MRRRFKQIAALALSSFILLESGMTAKAETGYTYNYDYWGDVQYSPDAYETAGVFNTTDMGLDKKLASPEGLYVKDNLIYICDTGNNRIVVLERTNTDSVELVKIIDRFYMEGYFTKEDEIAEQEAAEAAAAESEAAALEAENEEADVDAEVSSEEVSEEADAEATENSEAQEVIEDEEVAEAAEAVTEDTTEEASTEESEEAKTTEETVADGSLEEATGEVVTEDGASTEEAEPELQKSEDPTRFSGPSDIAIDEEGNIYIADKGNNRILKLDSELNYLMEFTKPTDATFDQSLSFLPSKIAIDTAGRVYCVAQNANKGLVKYENDGTFSGFVGATPVTYDWTDYIWKKFATQAQRAKLESFVPTEYDNLYMDYEGFIYVCTTNVKESEVANETADVIRKLNLMGNDILVRNGDYPVIGDIDWGNGGGFKGNSLIIDITTMDNDVYVGLDKVRGRLFAYDDQGRMLFAFGGNGNMDGYFKQPSALEHMGHDLLVLDSLDSSLTIFTPTGYGNDIYNAIEQFQDGNYEESGKSWHRVMDQNGNYDLAYIGIGRALLRQKQYHEAMGYFKLKYDDENYSKAFKQYRKQWVEDHIGIIFLVVIILLGLPLAIGKVRKIKFEIDHADIFQDER